MRCKWLRPCSFAEILYYTFMDFRFRWEGNDFIIIGTPVCCHDFDAAAWILEFLLRIILTARKYDDGWGPPIWTCQPDALRCVNRTVVFRAIRLNQCHQYDFDSHHVSGIHQNFSLLNINIDSIFDEYRNILLILGIKISWIISTGIKKNPMNKLRGGKFMKFVTTNHVGFTLFATVMFLFLIVNSFHYFLFVDIQRHLWTQFQLL